MRGYQTVLLCLKPLAPSLVDSFQDSFDCIADDLRSFALLGELATRVHADIFHIQCWMWGYHIARHIIDCAGDTPCVCEFYDVTSALLPRDKLYELMASRPDPVGMVDFDLAMEACLFRKADGIVHRLSGDLIAGLQSRYRSLAPTLYFPPWPTTAFCAFSENRLSDETGRHHVVYAGAVHPDSTDPALSSIGNLSETIGKLLSQGVAVDLYLDPHRSIFESRDDYASWFQLDDAYDIFRMFEGVPPQELPNVLSRYDYGLLALEIHPDALNNLANVLDGAIGTKVFSYLEAGLPVLVDCNAKFVAGFLKEYGVGLPVYKDDLKDLAAFFSTADKAGLQANVRRFCSENSMEARIGELEDFYTGIMDIASGRLSKGPGHG